MKKTKKYWLMKSEPGEYSIDDLQKLGQDFWFGIRNYQVRNMFRDDFAVGDMALFYHSNSGKETGVVGVMEIVSESYPDATQFDKTDKYFDAKSTQESPRWLGVDVKFVSKLPRLVTLSEIKSLPVFADLPLVKKGNRLSVMPVSKKHFDRIIKLAEK